MFWANRDARHHPGGRRAGCPHPAAPHAAADTPVLKLPRCGGRERPPYGAGKTWWQTGKAWQRKAPREGHGPPLQTTANARPNGMAAAPRYCNLCRGRCSHRPGDLAAARGSSGGINPAPTNKFCVLANRDGRNHPDDRRAGCPHPAGPCGGANAPVLKLPRCGGRERPPYGAGRNMVAGRQSVATQGPAGGPWPSPTNHGKRPAKRDGRRPALLQPL